MLIDVVGELFLDREESLNSQGAALFQDGRETERSNWASRSKDLRTDGTGGGGDRRSGGTFLGGGGWSCRGGLLALGNGKREQQKEGKKDQGSAEARPRSEKEL